MASVFGPLYLSDLRALTRDQRVRPAAIVRELQAAPEADGIWKRALPPPFKPGTLVATSRGLAVRYAIEPDGLRFYRVQLVER